MIDDSVFTAAEVLAGWQRNLDARGLRATGSDAHHAYVEDLVVRLRGAGVQDVWSESMPMRRWTPQRWSLGLADETDVPVVAPVAYSGRTGSAGVTGPLSAEPAAGCVGVADVALLRLPAAFFDVLDWDGPSGLNGLAEEAEYARVWLSQETMREELARYAGAGAAGLVLIVDLPAAAMTGGYLLYDGVHRDLPAVFVSREQRARLHSALARGESATLVLEAQVAEVETANVIGLIPGVSDELVVLQSHTDGTNGLEDNGPEAILAMAHYLAGMPAAELPRSVLILLTTGHFAINEAWGLENFLERHRDDLVPRIAAALCLEHLGALPWALDEQPGAPMHPYEFGCFFASPHQTVIDIVRRGLDRAEVTESRVLRPFVADLNRRSLDRMAWPGDGSPFWHTAGLPSANFITGPGYLLNVEPVADLIDIHALRRQAIAFTQAVLELCAAPLPELHARRPDDR